MTRAQTHSQATETQRHRGFFVKIGSRWLRVSVAAVTVAVVATLLAPLAAQNRTSPPPPALPGTFFTAELMIRVVPVVTGLTNPWSIAFLPDGAMLVTERPGRLRIIRTGVVDPTPIAGVPQVRQTILGGLMEVALHPKFAENQLLYLTYTKAR